MRIAILGGWADESDRNKEWNVDENRQAQIIEACRALGHRLAHNRHSVIVGSEKKRTVLTIMSSIACLINSKSQTPRFRGLR